MKKANVFLIILMILSILQLPLVGIISDTFPNVDVKAWEYIMFWALPVLIGASLFVTDKKKIVLSIVVTVFLFSTVVCGRLFYAGYSYYGASYEISNNIDGISLDYLEKIVEGNDEFLVYIGREDCEECSVFEEELDKILAEKELSINGYYTSRDRDGKRSDEMYEVLKSIEVNSVPALLYVSGGSGGVKHVDVTNMNEVKAIIKEYYEK